MRFKEGRPALEAKYAEHWHLARKYEHYAVTNRNHEGWDYWMRKADAHQAVLLQIDAQLATMPR